MPEPRPSKRERTRRSLLDAGLQVLAERGDALTASDVVHAADVSNGTFYNHFADRDAFVRELAHESLVALTVASATETEGADPAWRFAVGSTRVLQAASRQPLWAHAVLRLAELPAPPHEAIQAHLRTDLADGHAAGRFRHGDDPITVDLVSGTLMATLRRFVDGPGHGIPIADVVARLLIAVGMDEVEAQSIAERTLETELQLID